MNVTSGSQAVTSAGKWLGTPYCWGGGHSGPVPVGTCVDCSGLVNQVFGITGNTGTQVTMGTAVSGISNAAPGDLVFFGPLAPGEPYHVGIYTGGGMMIDAPHTGTNVRFDTVAGFGTVDGIRRLVPSGGANGNPSTGSVQYTYAQLEAVWIQAGGNAQYAPIAAAIAMAESGGNSAASNTNSNNSIDRGLWQINSSNGAGSSFDVMTNARTAVQMSNGGTNWRPWCTAYSDGACGSKGGCYQCPGSPYLKYLQTGVAPDYSAPVNATNAQLTGFLGLPDPFGIGNIGSDIVKSLVGSILNPLIAPIVGLMGITAGGIMVIAGIWIVVSGTRAGQAVTKVAGTGISAAGMVTGQPEVIAAGAGVSAGGVRGGVSRAGTQRIETVRGQQMEARQATAQQRRIQTMTTQQQLNMQAAQYAEYLRRTRPPRSR